VSARITIPLSAAPEVIADAVRRGLKAMGYELMRFGGVSAAKVIDADELERFVVDCGRQATQALMVVDETPIEEVDVEYEPGVKPRKAMRK
jgi:hypothetical protein